MKKELLSQLAKIANALRGTGLKAKEAFKRAWAVLRLKMSMHNQPTRFTYVKDGGEIREAVGYYSDEHKPNPDAKPGSPLVVKYWDMTANGWRSFRIDRLLIPGL